MQKSNLRNLFFEFMDKYAKELADARETENYKRPFGSLVRKEITKSICSFVTDPTYYIKGSVGAGRWTDVPWIAVFDRRITKSAQKGVYIVYLLNKDTKELYLTFNQGATDVAQEGGASDGKLTFTGIASSTGNKTLDKLKIRAKEIRENLNIGEGIDVDQAETGSPAYNAGCICYKKYTLNNLPDDEELQKDLLAYIEIYRRYYSTINKLETMENWWPSLEEYDPLISKDQWVELLNNPEIIGPIWGKTLALFYLEKEGATCSEIAEKYGESAQSIRSQCTQLAKKVYQYANCPLYVRDNGDNRFYTILFVGRDAATDQKGSYIWKLRQELYDACTETNILRFLEEGEEAVSIPAKEAIPQIESYIASKGFSYEGKLIENFYLSLKSKPFVILAGTSGTGKTRIVKLFAEAIGAEYKLVSVRPDWSDGSDLFGHHDLNGNFIEGPICECFDKAYSNPKKPVFLCLDEMNLARVEYYLSDFLSVIESRDKTVNGSIITDGIAQYKKGIPDNLYIVGTVNMDETTFPFSKKVLDRANTIEFNYVDLIPSFDVTEEDAEPLNLSNAFLRTQYLVLAKDCSEEADYVSGLCTELQEINKILLEANAHVGYRVRDEIVFYMLNNKESELLSEEEAFDNEIMQKILPRIQGSSASVKDMLIKLFKVCAADPKQKSGDSEAERMKNVLKDSAIICKYRNSAEKIEMMVRRFEEDGFTSYWL